MEGIFLRKKFNIRLFLLFTCGLFFIGFCIFMNIADSMSTGKPLTFLIIGILIILAVIPSWLFNFGAFIHISKDSIKAKFHWFGKIDCKLSDVTFAVARNNTLIIQLKDGKTHTITGVKNSYPLSSMIRRNMYFNVIEQPKVLIEKINIIIKSAKKKMFINICSGIALMFIIIFITVFLTGERELYEFSNVDWIIFANMIATEIALVIAIFYFAQKLGKHNFLIEKLQYAIQRRIIETQPLLPGNIIKVFADANYTVRITFFGFPNQTSVYYVVQEVASDFTFFKSYESEIFENIEQLQDSFITFIDITEKVLH